MFITKKMLFYEGFVFSICEVFYPLQINLWGVFKTSTIRVTTNYLWRF